MYKLYLYFLLFLLYIILVNYIYYYISRYNVRVRARKYLNDGESKEKTQKILKNLATSEQHIY